MALKFGGKAERQKGGREVIITSHLMPSLKKLWHPKETTFHSYNIVARQIIYILFKSGDPAQLTGWRRRCHLNERFDRLINKASFLAFYAIKLLKPLSPLEPLKPLKHFKLLPPFHHHPLMQQSHASYTIHIYRSLW